MTWDTLRTLLRAPCETASRRGRAATRPVQARGQAQRAGRVCSSVPSSINNSGKIEGGGEIRKRIPRVVTHTPFRRLRFHAITHLDTPLQAFPFTRTFFVLFSLIFLPRRSFFTCGKACVRGMERDMALVRRWEIGGFVTDADGLAFVHLSFCVLCGAR